MKHLQVSFFTKKVKEDKWSVTNVPAVKKFFLTGRLYHRILYWKQHNTNKRVGSNMFETKSEEKVMDKGKNVTVCKYWKNVRYNHN